MHIPESQNSRDARIEQLWSKLDPQKKGELDINGLRKGLHKIDHPLKNADNMLEDIVKAMDKNGDKVIQFDEFRTFVKKTETELLALFKSIDRDQDGRLDKKELRAAFKSAGLSVPNSKLDQFFSEVDRNHDGFITFAEWRNFLLFLPSNAQVPELKQILSYYSSTITLNAEGDTSISEETLEGLGRTSFLSALFGVIIKIADPPKPPRPPLDQQEFTSEVAAETPATNDRTYEVNHPRFVEVALEPEIHQSNQLSDQSSDEDMGQQDLTDDFSSGLDNEFKKSLLTEILPDPGYFAAGGIAGAISRTATAPLDRLKVYLIANTGRAPQESLDAVAKGEAVKSAKAVGRPLVNATRELWKAGGIRSLFAGNGLNVVKVMPESAIKFGSYEAAKRALAQLEGHGNPQNINPYSKFVAGGVGGLVSQLFVYPIDTLKFRMQCETVAGGLRGNALIIETAKKMYLQGGIRSSYRGLTMGLVGMFPYSAIDLGTFEFLKAALTSRNAKLMGCHEDDALPGSFATGCIGAFSGAFGASVVYPINLLRTRLQAQGTVLHPPTYTGIVDVTRKTIKNEGIRGLFKGITPNLLKVVPAVSITYVVYENAKKVMHLR
ncbi:calcium dependent mitochondrial carrier protein-like protein [Amylocarpus encephaloides]|uniref:Mitochondrial thiamine pyrophosphate carrier 1 n=1 Tax=Amylocarpus encephaloides TaxID=45428 RepID=A0A9P8BZ77_9HELO|nr:calcium dependent mitochondrial carrier protein-like protein [Amylocarpus encephaloides]